MLSPLLTARPAVAVTAVAAWTFVEELQGLLFTLRWALLFVVVLVLTDLWSGIAVSIRVHREAFRRSRAVRRTIAKFMEYFCFILIAALLSKSILLPYGIGTDYTGGAIGATIVLLVEADSIVENVCLLHNVRAHFSILRALLAVVRIKNPTAAKAIESGLEQPPATSEAQGKAERTTKNEPTPTTVKAPAAAPANTTTNNAPNT